MKREEAICRIQRALSVPNRLQGLVLIDEESAKMATEALQFQDIMINNPKSAKPMPEVCKNCHENNRPQGEWIHDKMSVPPHYLMPSCYCNQCGVFVAQESNYCPNCGADMKGKEE